MVMHDFCEAGGLGDLTSWCNGVWGRGALGGRDSTYSFGRLYSVSVLREDVLRAGVVIWCDWLREGSGPRGNWYLSDKFAVEEEEEVSRTVSKVLQVLRTEKGLLQLELIYDMMWACRGSRLKNAR